MRTVYPCKEFEPVELPLDQLIADGRIDIYEAVRGKGYFDIDYRGGKIVLAPTSYVGFIPVNDRVAVHVVPRFPIVNLLHLLGKANALAKYVVGHFRTYEAGSESDTDPTGLFGRQFLWSLRTLKTDGLLRRYVAAERDDSLRGEILMSETVSRFLSRGVRYRQVRRVHELTPNLPENRLVKAALYKLADFYCRAEEGPSRTDAEKLYPLFDLVAEEATNRGIIGHLLPRYVRELPTTHKGYASVLWLAYLIETRRGVALDKLGPISFDTFVVNLADVFEDYVRAVLLERIGDHFPGASLLNGNVTNPPLFVQGEKFTVKPDMYVRNDKRNVAVFDAKYKEKIKATDRQEILTFCEALQAKVAATIAPSRDGKCDVRLSGRTEGGISLYQATIDIGAKDMPSMEREFASKLMAIVPRSAMAAGP